MKNISDKFTTFRTARAEAVVTASKKAVAMCKNGSSPKGNVIDVARVAGITAAKKTFDLIPFCHQIPLDHVSIEIKCSKTSIRITADAKAVAKTGVEMEALTAATVSALTVYDMLKPVDKKIIIGEIRLVEKRGGKSDFFKIPKNKTAAVLIPSDRAAKDKAYDRTGPFIFQTLKKYKFKTLKPMIVPNDDEAIVLALENWCRKGVDLVITSGGTGIGPRDRTVEATRQIIEKELPGIAETVRANGTSRTPFAMLSRCVAGLCGKTLIVNLPGSLPAVKESLGPILPAILHAFDMIGGKPHA